MPGFDAKRFIGLDDWLSKELECSICLQIFDKAVDTHCGHTFCLDCIQKIVINNRLVCPQCRHESQRKRQRNLSIDCNINESILKSNRRIDSIINKLKTNCDFEPKGCEEVLELGSLSAHLEKCLYNLCEKCGLKVGKPSDHNCILLMKSERKRFMNTIIGYKFKLKQSDIKYKELQQKNTKLEAEIKRLKANITTTEEPNAKKRKTTRSGMALSKTINVFNQFGAKVSAFRMKTNSTFDELIKFMAKTFETDDNVLKLFFKFDQSLDNSDTLSKLNITCGNRKPLNAYYSPEQKSINIDFN